MKAHRFNPDQKKWFITLCLMATLSFNLSHLVDQPKEGSAELMSGAANEPAAPSDQGPAPQTTGAATAKPTTAAPAVARTEEVNAKDGVVELAGGRRAMAKFTKTAGNRVIVNLEDENLDPCKKEGGNPPDGKWGRAIIDISITADLKDIEKKASEKFCKTAKSEDKKEEKKTAKQEKEDKEKKAKELLEEIESRCDGRKDEAKLDCYAREIKSTLKDADNRKVLTDDLVTDFIERNVATTLKEVMVSSEFEGDARKLVKKFHEAFQGKYADAHKAILKASADAVNTQKEEYTNEVEKLRDLRRTADSAYTEMQRITRSRECTVDTVAWQGCQQQLYDLAKERNEALAGITKQQRHLLYKRAVISKNRGFVRDENRDGLNFAVENYRSLGMERTLRDSLLRQYDTLTDMKLISDFGQLTSDLSVSGREAPSLSRPVGLSASTPLKNDARFLKPGERVILPTGLPKVTITRPVVNGTTPVVTNPVVGNPALGYQFRPQVLPVNSYNVWGNPTGLNNPFRTGF